MQVAEKLRILAESAKYDVSCSSSGSKRKNFNNGIGNAYQAGICHSWSSDGRCISLLKILMSNECIYNCEYCVNKVTNDVPRATFTSDEIADLTINFYRRNYIEGLFLSSAIYKSPDYTMEIMIKAVKKLRLEYKFNGYIHMKGIPGADLKLLRLAGLFVDRLSVNIELPSERSLNLLAPQKKKDHIINSMKFLSTNLLENKEDKIKYKKNEGFLPAGQTTQLIVGATKEPDLTILKLSEGMYKKMNMKRVYYSAYIPVADHPNLPSIVTEPPLLREHRLYQADWLLRFYNFSADELLNENKLNFDINLDPKSDWALSNLSLFPVEINKASYEILLRVPGIGVRSAKKIVIARKVRSLSFEDLKKMRVSLRRAQYFITCKGKYYSKVNLNEKLIRDCLIYEGTGKYSPQKYENEQLTIFNYKYFNDTSAITGEL
jgi:putative DNA modification/repair radical SAM protein